MGHDVRSPTTIARIIADHKRFFASLPLHRLNRVRPLPT